MTLFRVVYLPLAQKDLLDIFDYIKDDNLPSAYKLLEDFDKALERLSRFPKSGVLPKDRFLRSKGYRVVVFGDYLAFYILKGSTVEVRRIIHGKRNFSSLILN